MESMTMMRINTPLLIVIGISLFADNVSSNAALNLTSHTHHTDHIRPNVTVLNPRQMLQRFAVTHNKPEQIHISFGSKATDIVIMWSSSSNDKSFVEYGYKPQKVYRVVARSIELKEHNDHGKKFIHRAELPDLIPGTHYSYRIVSGISEIKSKRFTVDLPPEGSETDHTFMVVADMGLLTKSLQFVVHEALSNRYEAVFHVGDIAYDLNTQGGSFGDQFMNRIEKLTSKVPYMVIPGDHERHFHFYHYRHRFSAPGRNWPMKEQELWYSLDIGHAHIIAINTEAVHLSEEFQKEQLYWLRKDLIKANQNRKQFPWMIVMGHMPMYCTKTKSNLDLECSQEVSGMRDALEDLLYEYGVDLYIGAHKHCYERSWPMYKSHALQMNTIDPKAPIYIVIGTLGFEYMIHEQTSNPKWLAASFTEKGREVFARLKVVNSTHLLWSAHVATNNKKVDEMLIIQNRHGPFGARRQAVLGRSVHNLPPSVQFSSLSSNSLIPSHTSFSIYDPMNRNVMLLVGVFSFSFLVFLFMRYTRLMQRCSSYK